MAEIDGMEELKASIRKLEKLPQRIVTKAAKKGASVAYKSAKSRAPVGETRNLKKGIVIRPEKARIKGKKVYEITMDRNMNDVFAKVSKSGKRSYYPASQEYGFMTRDGGYVPGYRFFRRSIEENVSSIESAMVGTMSAEIDKL